MVASGSSGTAASIGRVESNKLRFAPSALRPIGTEQMADAAARAAGSPRRRAIVRYHEHHEGVQRMVHAIEPASYVRPHKHEDPDKTEVFVALRGSALVLRWSDGGEIEERLELAAGGPRHGVEIPPRTWHSLLALEPRTVLYEIVEGAYDPAAHKAYAAWAPEEGSAAADEFHRALRARLGLEERTAGRG